MLIDSLVQIELHPIRRSVEVGDGWLDAAGRGACFLALIGRELRLLRGLCFGFGVDGLAGARTEFGGALTLRFEARFVGVSPILVARGAFARGLLLLRFFRWQGGSFFPVARGRRMVTGAPCLL